jgi:hypothetical protein
MKVHIEDRRQHSRGDDILTKIEDVTYAVLRNSQQNFDSHSRKQA